MNDAVLEVRRMPFDTHHDHREPNVIVVVDHIGYIVGFCRIAPPTSSSPGSRRPASSASIRLEPAGCRLRPARPCSTRRSPALGNSRGSTRGRRAPYTPTSSCTCRRRRPRSRSTHRRHRSRLRRSLPVLRLRPCPSHRTRRRPRRMRRAPDEQRRIPNSPQAAAAILSRRRARPKN